MNRYEITLIVPTMGKVKHVVRADSKEAAAAKAINAHDQPRVVLIKELAKVEAVE